jgi:signal transduction histidine kinase
MTILSTAPDGVSGMAPAHDGLVRSAREETVKVWLRVPVSVVVSGFLFAFVGATEALLWLAAVLALEGVCMWARWHLIAGHRGWRQVYLAGTLGVSLCWVIHALLLWRTGSEIAHIATVMDLFTVALYGAIGAQKDRQLMLILLAPPLAALSILLIGYLWEHATPAIAAFASVATLGACATIALNAFAMHRSDRQLSEAIAALDTERRALDVRVKARTAELSLAMEAAQAANRAKSEFLATMSHELRTPLNAVIGYAEILAEDLRADPATARVEDTEHIATAARKQLALIDDILDISRIEAGRMDLHFVETDVRVLLDGLVEAVAPTAAANGNTLALEVADDVGVCVTDAARLRQCVLNLAGNACKFTTNGAVRIAAHTTAASGVRWLEIAVIDTGCGIASAQAEKVFEPFVQADSSATRRHGGAGLGLAITSRLAGLLGGSVSMESALGAGSRFTLRVPMAPGAPQPVAR